MKKAFTLAETLLVLLIIGVLIGLCVTAGRNSLQKAYNLYYYQAINTLNIAFNDFIFQGKHKNPNDPSKGVANACSDLLEHLENLRNDDFGDSVTYECVPPWVPDSPNFFSEIKITVPKVKTYKDESDKDTISVIFITGYKHCEDYTSNGLNTELIISPQKPQKYDKIIDNHYILPTFVDDGEIGRELVDANGNYSYKPIIPMSYRWSYCASANPNDENSIFGKLDSIRDLMCPQEYKSELEFEISKTGLTGHPIRFLKPSIMR